eukprot:scaffold3273_cov363-Prasinococcus_capsulatus_cf.AAC.5
MPSKASLSSQSELPLSSTLRMRLVPLLAAGHGTPVQRCSSLAWFRRQRKLKAPQTSRARCPATGPGGAVSASPCSEESRAALCGDLTVARSLS